MTDQTLPPHITEEDVRLISKIAMDAAEADGWRPQNIAKAEALLDYRDRLWDQLVERHGILSEEMVGVLLDMNNEAMRYMNEGNS